MSQSAFRTTVSCHKRDVLTVGGQWFVAEYLVTDSSVKQVAVVTPREDKRQWLRLHYVKENERVELFPDVFVTFTDLAKRSKVRLRIEAPVGVPISRGYPRQQKPREFIPLEQTPLWPLLGSSGA